MMFDTPFQVHNYIFCIPAVMAMKGIVVSKNLNL